MIVCKKDRDAVEKDRVQPRHHQLHKDSPAAAVVMLADIYVTQLLSNKDWIPFTCKYDHTLTIPWEQGLVVPA